MKPFDGQWRLLRVEADGMAVAPAFATINNAVYLPASKSAAPVRWQIEFETDGPQWVDVHTF